MGEVVHGNNDQVVHAPIIHVAGAVTDTDETYGAYLAAENNTFINNTSNSSSNSNSNSDSNSNSGGTYRPSTAVDLPKR